MQPAHTPPSLGGGDAEDEPQHAQDRPPDGEAGSRDDEGHGGEAGGAMQARPPGSIPPPGFKV